MGLTDTIATDVSARQLRVDQRVDVGWLARVRDDWQTVRWLAPLVFLHTLLYVFLVPPWQHYDEPGHFLYAAYIVRGGITAPDHVAVAREVADSMYRHAFWPPEVRPDLLSPSPPGIPTDQREHQPLYYILMAGPLSILRYMPVEIQLYAVRLLSASMMMFTALAVWRTASIIMPAASHIPLLVTALVVLTPAYSDLMSAMNSDVLMNMAAAAAFLGFAIVLRDGWRPTGLLLAGLGTLVAVMTKRTAVPLVFPLVIAILWGIYRARVRWWFYLLGSVAGVGALVGVGFDWTSEGLRARPWLAMLEQHYLRTDIMAWLVSWLDWERAWPWYRITIEVAHNHFWVRLAWGHIAVLPPIGDWLFIGLSIVALIGLLRGWLVWRGELPLWQQRWLWLCLVVVVVAWIVLLGRLHPLPEQGRPYIPRGRYLYWAMLPTIWLLASGWQMLWPERWRLVALYALVVMFALIDLAALVTLVTFYY